MERDDLLNFDDNQQKENPKYDLNNQIMGFLMAMLGILSDLIINSSQMSGLSKKKTKEAINEFMINSLNGFNLNALRKCRSTIKGISMNVRDNQNNYVNQKDQKYQKEKQPTAKKMPLPTKGGVSPADELVGNLYDKIKQLEDQSKFILASLNNK